MHLVIGLGNPGSRYEGTRHNVGFRVVDLLAARHGLTLGRQRFQSRFAQGFIGGVQAVLAQPQTYMNLSGEAVRQIVAYFGVGLSELLVVHDDLYLDVGRLKIVTGGGNGGHKGVGSLIECLKDGGFARIKVGIGLPDAHMAKEAFVLSRFQVEEEVIVERAVEQAADAAEMVLSQGLARAQTRFNRKGLEN